MEDEYRATQNATTGGINNYGNPDTATAINLRLDTHAILQDYYLFLAGKRIANVEQKDGTISEQIIDDELGKRRVSNEGMGSIIGFLKLMINPHTAQGNINQADHKSYMRMAHKALAKDIWRNRFTWKIEEEDFPMILRGLTGLLYFFTTRPIEDKERQSLIGWLKSVETTVKERENKRGFPSM